MEKLMVMIKNGCSQFLLVRRIQPKLEHKLFTQSNGKCRYRCFSLYLSRQHMAGLSTRYPLKTKQNKYTTNTTVYRFSWLLIKYNNSSILFRCFFLDASTSYLKIHSLLFLLRIKSKFKHEHIDQPQLNSR